MHGADSVVDLRIVRHTIREVLELIRSHFRWDVCAEYELLKDDDDDDDNDEEEEQEEEGEEEEGRADAHQ